MNLRDIAKRYVLNDTELNIVETIMNELAIGNERISIRELASKTFVSTTTIINLAKKLGFIGYSQMIYILNDNIHKQVSIHNNHSLEEFIHKEDMDTMQQLINDIHTYRDQKIYLVGIGFSGMITGYFLKRLAEFDIFAYEGAPIDCINARSKPSIVIIFSKSGETEDIIQIINLSKKMGHKIYSITATQKSTIAKLSDYHIQLQFQQNKFFETPDYYVGTAIFVIENILTEVLKKESA